MLRPEVPWSEVGAQGLHEPCELDVEEVVLHVPIARHESQHKKLKVVLWLAMMYSAQAIEGSPVAESHCERVLLDFLERVTRLTEAATAAANAATQALHRCRQEHQQDWRAQQEFLLSARCVYRKRPNYISDLEILILVMVIIWRSKISGGAG